MPVMLKYTMYSTATAYNQTSRSLSRATQVSGIQVRVSGRMTYRTVSNGCQAMFALD
jgi:hypothetical protein